MNKEIITGNIYTNNISELVNEINQNKDKFHSFIFDRQGNYFSFKIIHEDYKDAKKIFKIIDKFIKQSTKGKVKREKNGIITDEYSK